MQESSSFLQKINISRLMSSPANVWAGDWRQYRRKY
nr:hypothetical protein [Enterobacter hormaechei]